MSIELFRVSGELSLLMCFILASIQPGPSSREELERRVAEGKARIEELEAAKAVLDEVHVEEGRLRARMKETEVRLLTYPAVTSCLLLPDLNRYSSTVV